MDVKIFKNFLSKEECCLLNEIALANIDTWFGKGYDNGCVLVDTRITTRKHMGDAHYPKEVLEIANRVRAKAGVDKHPIIDDHGADGVVVTIAYKGGDVYEHNDPRGKLGHLAYRCNILSQAPDGGAELYVNNNKIDIGAGDLHCYFASELPHKVTKVEGKTPRIMWMFGAYIPLPQKQEA